MKIILTQPKRYIFPLCSIPAFFFIFIHTFFPLPVMAYGQLLAETDELKAFSETPAAWCRRWITIWVRARKDIPFTEDYPGLSTLFKQLDSVLEKECPTLERMVINGSGGSTPGFTVIAKKKSDGWVTPNIEVVHPSNRSTAKVAGSSVLSSVKENPKTVPETTHPSRVVRQPRPSSTQPQLTTQSGHAGLTGGITSMAFSPDGRLLVTGGQDKIAILWETESGREIRRFVGHSEKLKSVAFSPDGKLLVTGSEDKTSCLWDISDREQMQCFSHPSPVEMSMMSPDGRLLLTAARDGARLWDISSAKELRRLGTTITSVVAFSPDGRLIFTSEDFLGVRVWETDTGKELHTLIKREGYGDVVAFSPNGRLAATAPGLYSTRRKEDEDAVRLWDMSTGVEIRKLGEGRKMSSLVFSPDSRFLITADLPKDAKKLTLEERRLPQFGVSLWNVATGKEVRRFTQWTLTSATNLSPDGRWLATVTFNTLSLRNVTSSGMEPRQLGKEEKAPREEHKADAREPRQFGEEGEVQLGRHSAPIMWLAFSPKGPSLFTGSVGLVARIGSSNQRGRNTKSNLDGVSVRLWDLTTGTEAGSLGSLPGNSGKGVSEDGNFFVSQVGDDIVLYSTDTWQIVQRFKGAGALYDAVLSPDGKSLASITANDGKAAVRLWEVSTGREVRKLEHPAPVNDLTFSPDGQLLLTASGGRARNKEINSFARLWNITTGIEVRNFAHAKKIDKVRISPEGRFIATSSGKEIVLYEASTGQEVQRFVYASEVRSFSFSSDGRFVLAGAFQLQGDNVAYLRNTETGQEVRQFVGHTGPIWDVTFIPGGQYIVTAGDDSTTRIWRIETGEELCRLLSFADDTWVVVTPEGRFDTNNFDQNLSLSWIMADAPLTPLPLEIFMRDYYEPRLLPRLLAGEKFAPVRPLNTLNRVQPIVKITKIEAQSEMADSVSVTVSVAQGKTTSRQKDGSVSVNTGVYNLRLFRDGQLIGYAPEKDGEMEVDPNTGTKTITFPNIKLPRIEGVQQVEFSAYAFNEDRVKSATDRQTFSFSRPLVPRKGRTYLITIGVNAYENPAWDLQYAANDARRIHELLQQQLSQTGQYDEVVSVPLISDYAMRDGTRVLTERSATKARLRAVLDILAGREIGQRERKEIPNGDRLQRVTPEDFILISLSSHGYRDEKGDFYFLLFDIGPGNTKTVSSILFQHALSSQELSLWLRDVDAGELVLIVDACHSAASIEGQEFKPAPMGSRGLGQLAYDKGMRVLTSTQSEDLSLESDLIQQGILSYALISDGIKAGRADFKPQDNMITLPEWLGYGVMRVPQLYEEIQTGRIRSFEKGGMVRGAEAVPVPGGPVLKKAVFQLPALFDFTTGRRASRTIRIRGR